MPHMFYFHELTCGRFLRYARVPLTRQCKKKRKKKKKQNHAKKESPVPLLTLKREKFCSYTHPHSLKKNTSAISKAVKAVGEKIGSYFGGRHHRERVLPLR